MDGAVEAPKPSTMMYAIQHRTSQRWIACPPSSCSLTETLHEAEATAWPMMSLAELERAYLYPFHDAYHVVPIRRGITR